MTESERGALLSRMTDEAVAAMFGWTTAKVVRLRAVLAAKAAPPGLAGLDLANWLIDNTAGTFAWIAAYAKVRLHQVQELADHVEEEHHSAGVLEISATKQPPADRFTVPVATSLDTAAERLVAMGEPDTSDIPEAGPEWFAKAKVVAPTTPLEPRQRDLVRWWRAFTKAGWSEPHAASLFNRPVGLFREWEARL